MSYILVWDYVEFFGCILLKFAFLLHVILELSSILVMIVCYIHLEVSY